MSTLTDRLPQLLADQRADGVRHDDLIAQSNRALATEDLAAAGLLADMAYEVSTRIRARTNEMTAILDAAEARLHQM